jgi:two-component system, cell cycle response regulator DivK
MPRMSGVTATRYLKNNARTRRIPVIILTGRAAQAIQEGALEMGADMFLTKPCLPEDLEQQVARLLRGLRAR